MMNEPNHTPCILKKKIEFPIACLSTNIGLETNNKFEIPQNVPTPHGHAS
jgi:hypothetical protein